MAMHISASSGDGKRAIFSQVKETAPAARILLRTALKGSLATLAKGSGHPYASLALVATDSDGSPIKGEAEGRFLAYATDLENARPGADPAFLQRLAAAGGGRYRKAGERELVQYLEELRAQSVPQARPRGAVWPDWRRNPASPSAGDQVATLWASGLLLSFGLFVTFLCVEWYLRRRWGMV